jgi:nicotinate phosphoribosyltransferase
MPIIKSLLETDLYKFTMWQPMLNGMQENQARYEFVCRNRPEFPLSELADEVNAELDYLCTLRFTEDELHYLGSLRYIKRSFVDFLRIFQFQRQNIKVYAEGDVLRITAQGSQIHVMGFEIYVLAIVNELYFRRLSRQNPHINPLKKGRALLSEKINLLQNTLLRQNAHDLKGYPFIFFEFGVRRRFSGEWQEEVVRTLANELPDSFKGTSNVYLAKKFNLTPVGTMAHEYLQTFQAMRGVQLRYFQKVALDKWVQEYRGDLGIALTDVVGMDAFLADFDLFFAKLFDGLRHDSGDPIEWGEKALAHYAKLGIEPSTKRLVFSDGLDIPTALRLHEYFMHRVPTGFGIGTNLSNDVGFTPLNIVMKLIDCNGQPTAKLSDSPGKTLCDNPIFLDYLRQVFEEK